jgi:aryl-alcohol dehydrogenase-like predicted oxidoreductase
MQKIANMKPIADSRGWNITELAIKFILSQPQISVVLPTMISVEEIEMFAAISDGNYLAGHESAKLEEMYEKNFGVEPVASTTTSSSWG